MADGVAAHACFALSLQLLAPMYSIPFLDLPPLESAGGTIRLPGSKSISNRVLLLAGLAEGATEVHDLLDSDDTQVMIDALVALGCTIDPLGRDALRIGGIGGRLQAKEAGLFLGNAGTAMRPLTAALAVLASVQGGRFELRGVQRMHERPIGDLVDALRQLGCDIVDLGQPGYPPLRVQGPAPGGLKLQDPIRVRGDVSSQFLTALLLALPLVSADSDIVIEVEGELISKPYIHITLELLDRFGVRVQREDWQRFVIPPRSRLKSPGAIWVEGDASSASYFVAMGALAAVQEPIRIEGVGTDSIQGDIDFVDAARAMGAQVNSAPGCIEVRRGRWPLQAITIDCNAIPDAAMTLAVMALYAEGTTRLTNIASWRVKETDRVAAMAAELRRLGAGVVEGADFIEVSAPLSWRSAALHTYDDHRMAMCLSLAAFNGLAGAPQLPQRILDPRCVGKTFPDYFEAMFRLTRTSEPRVPVITVDGPSASGKGTLASAIADALGYRFLDSGALYRASALSALQQGAAVPGGPLDEAALAGIASGLRIAFAGDRVFLDGREVTQALRDEDVGVMASRISALPALRRALVDLQLSFRRAPGLVADGRDMGTVMFPGAHLKIFLTASAATRAERRHRQLLAKGVSATIADLRAELEARDERDMNRPVAPLRPAEDAVMLDNSALTIEQSVAIVLQEWAQRSPFALALSRQQPPA